MGKIIDLIGEKFGKLEVIKKEKSNHKRKTSMWLCRCECGNTKIISSHDLKHGTISCGCESELNRKKFKEKYRKGVITKEKRLRNIYLGMIGRCLNNNSNAYGRYGGRGITICQEWLKDYFIFEKWALQHGYERNLTIDRINVNGNYEPSNCRWITNTEQQNNRRNNHMVEIDGIVHTIAEWSNISGIKQNTILYRIRRGKNNKEAVFSKTTIKRKSYGL